MREKAWANDVRDSTTFLAPSPVPAVPHLPVVVIGAGIGGASAALALSRTHDVVVLDAAGPAAGASGVSAGLVNAFTGRKATRGWRATEARAALDRFADAAGVLVEASGIVRPAGDDRQARAFRQTAAEWPGEAAFLEPSAARARWAHVEAPHGALLVPGGGHVDVPRLVRGALSAAERRGAETRTGVRLVAWREESDAVVAITDQGEIRARALVLCPGAARLPGLAALPFGRVKGQTVTLDARLPDGTPAVAGGTYVVPAAAGVLVGATFEHDYTSEAPDPAVSLALRARAARLVPALAEARIVDARAGVRLTVPPGVSAQRLPRLGRVAGRVWLFAGFGSRGLLTAPLLAEALPAFLADPSRADVDFAPRHV